MYTNNHRIKIMDAVKVVDEYSLNTKEKAISFLQVHMAYYQVENPYDLLKTLENEKELLMGLTKADNATSETEKNIEKVKKSLELIK